LFAVGCCRRISHLLTDERGRKVLDTPERVADGLATPEECQAFDDAVWDAVAIVADRVSEWYAGRAVSYITDPHEAAFDGAWKSGAARATEAFTWDTPEWDDFLRKTWAVVRGHEFGEDWPWEVERAEFIWTLEPGDFRCLGGVGE